MKTARLHSIFLQSSEFHVYNHITLNSITQQYMELLQPLRVFKFPMLKTQWTQQLKFKQSSSTAQQLMKFWVQTKWCYSRSLRIRLDYLSDDGKSITKYPKNKWILSGYTTNDVSSNIQSAFGLPNTVTLEMYKEDWTVTTDLREVLIAYQVICLPLRKNKMLPVIEK